MVAACVAFVGRAVDAWRVERQRAEETSYVVTAAETAAPENGDSCAEVSETSLLFDWDSQPTWGRKASADCVGKPSTSYVVKNITEINATYSPLK